MRAVLFLCVVMLMAATFVMASDEHSVDMERKSCITCHTDPIEVEKPEVVAQWNMSLHSYSGVTCGSCHGDELSFQKVPEVAVCASCHEVQVARTVSTKACADCHEIHTFSIHR